MGEIIEAILWGLIDAIEALDFRPSRRHRRKVNRQIIRDRKRYAEMKQRKGI